MFNVTMGTLTTSTRLYFSHRADRVLRSSTNRDLKEQGMLHTLLTPVNAGHLMWLKRLRTDGNPPLTICLHKIVGVSFITQTVDSRRY